jgi:site-specific recombinase XerD
VRLAALEGGHRGAVAHAGRSTRGAVATEAATFWDWALVELLVQSGLRIEEASELTTLDILKRQLPDGRVYYLLHIKPSMFDRARVIPIGDGLAV